MLRPSGSITTSDGACRQPNPHSFFFSAITSSTLNEVSSTFDALRFMPKVVAAQNIDDVIENRSARSVFFKRSTSAASTMLVVEARMLGRKRALFA
jgi:hypothetical protein